MSAVQRKSAALIFGIVFMLIAIFGFVGAWTVHFRDKAIEQNGNCVYGHLVKKSKVVPADDDVEYFVEYVFLLPGGEQLISHRSVSKRLWYTLKDGQSVVVLYSSTNPSHNFLKGEGYTSLGVPIFISALSFLFASFGILLFLGYARSSKQAA